MEIEENPVPSSARQRILGPSVGQGEEIFSEETPVRSGPRHWGQSAAAAVANGVAARSSNAGFMELILSQQNGKSMRRCNAGTVGRLRRRRRDFPAASCLPPRASRLTSHASFWRLVLSPPITTPVTG